MKVSILINHFMYIYLSTVSIHKLIVDMPVYIYILIKAAPNKINNFIYILIVTINN